MACAAQAAEKPRFRSLPARDLTRLQEEIAKAKQRFHLPADAAVGTGYEAGRDRFWLHRALTTLGIVNVVVDAGAIEVKRRYRRAKNDPIDAGKLLNLLGRYHGGERKVWSVVNVPTATDADRRPLHRGLKDLQRQQTECRNRIKGLLASRAWMPRSMPTSGARWRRGATGPVSRCPRACSGGGSRSSPSGRRCTARCVRQPMSKSGACGRGRSRTWTRYGS